MEILFQLDNLLYIIEASIAKSATQVLSDIQALIGTNLKHSPIIILLGECDEDGNPYVSNEIMTKVMKMHAKQSCKCISISVKKLIRELSPSSDLQEPSPALLIFQSLEKKKEQLPHTEIHTLSSLWRNLYQKKLQNRLIR